MEIIINFCEKISIEMFRLKMNCFIYQYYLCIIQCSMNFVGIKFFNILKKYDSFKRHVAVCTKVA